MTTDDQARDALILHLERSVKENRQTLRDDFAKAALIGLMADGRLKELWEIEGAGYMDSLADDAYLIADSMLMRRLK